MPSLFLFILGESPCIITTLNGRLRPKLHDLSFAIGIAIQSSPSCAEIEGFVLSGPGSRQGYPFAQTPSRASRRVLPLFPRQKDVVPRGIPCVAPWLIVLNPPLQLPVAGCLA
jgi:hypothetical protein